MARNNSCSPSYRSARTVTYAAPTYRTRTVAAPTVATQPTRTVSSPRTYTLSSPPPPPPPSAVRSYARAPVRYVTPVRRAAPAPVRRASPAPVPVRRSTTARRVRTRPTTVSPKRHKLAPKAFKLFGSSGCSGGT